MVSSDVEENDEDDEVDGVKNQFGTETDGRPISAHCSPLVESSSCSLSISAPSVFELQANTISPQHPVPTPIVPCVFV